MHSMGMHAHKGSCHCGAIAIELQTSRAPHKQVIGACQCSFCRKHNIRAFSDPKSRVVIEAGEPDEIHCYTFGLGTSYAVICRRCGVYMAMILEDEGVFWSTINIDVLNERALFTQTPQPRDYSKEDAAGRIARRRANWMPTSLVGWSGKADWTAWN